ncbi:unnamed protein product [Urochloa decumbens]|uniref:Uncharacterized protein n=1 Tax=Urochloa decumbens TaxID=240449 RepID=A0ABC9EZ40_9POAL
MDPKSNGEWSASEIMMMKSLITWQDSISSYTENMNKKHTNIVDELQAWFPWKEKRQITDLYANLMVEMKQTSNQCTATSRNPVTHNFAMSTEDPARDNINVLHSYGTEEMGAMRQAEEAPRKQSHNFWTKDEHKKFLHGLQVYGRSNWKEISMFSVKTRTPLQVSSHAQKYYRRLENTDNKQRYSINDVVLEEAEPWELNDASDRDGTSSPSLVEPTTRALVGTSTP